ncbi:alpha/beta fold hydrolase [Novosphingobium malaysiense]|uniref:AB hydrolase-1 domain-containing protein n=1 Tax=Novosphingobium malaysiense TaxID=1348853 RepID=A0A0B1ZKV2_9SPHN|nr:alpha/beta fold hydrolase [Novosphingobium malaysiense]KHK89808.1 hypothetical protein LK12_17950 [Novosphingobium malaysiense]
MARFILVHGAWHGGWCWEEVVPLLEMRGHTVLAPDLPGMGEDAKGGYVATLDEWAACIAGLAAAGPPPILVGHSRGGIVVSRAAEIAPRAIVRSVYLSAAMPLPGQSIREAFADFPSEAVQRAVVPSADGRTLQWSDRAQAAAFFFGTTPEHFIDAAFERFTAEPAAVADTPLVLSAGQYGTVPRTFVRCLRDNAVPLALQDKMIAEQPCETVTLDTDHSPFYCAPEDLAAVLDGLAGR